MSPRPASPFAANLSPPRSPSPLPSMQSMAQGLDLSLAYPAAKAPQSPPLSRKTSSGSSDARARKMMPAQTPSKSVIGTSSATARPVSRKVLGESSAHNILPVQNRSTVRTPKVKKAPGGRVAALRDENGEPRRPRAAPTGRAADVTADITGLTALLDTPAKGGAFDTLNKNENVGNEEQGGALSIESLDRRARLTNGSCYSGRSGDTTSAIARFGDRELSVTTAGEGARGRA